MNECKHFFHITQLNALIKERKAYDHSKPNFTQNQLVQLAVEQGIFPSVLSVKGEKKKK